MACVVLITSCPPTGDPARFSFEDHESVVVTNTSFVYNAEAFADRLSYCGRMTFFADLLAFLLAFFVGALLADYTAYLFFERSATSLDVFSLNSFYAFAFVGLSAVLWFDLKGHYRSRMPFWMELKQILSLVMALFFFHGFVFFFLFNDLLGFLVFYIWFFAGVFVVSGRRVLRGYLSTRDIWQVPTLLIGKQDTAIQSRIALSSDSAIGYGPLVEFDSAKLKSVTTADKWRELMTNQQTEMVIFAMSGTSLDKYSSSLEAAARAGIPYAIVPPWVGLPASTLSPQPFFSYNVALLPQSNRLSILFPRFLKRSMDVLASFCGLLVLSPLFLVLMLLITRDGGPPFYGQKRVGKNGKEFKCWKFRSMIHNADKVLQDLLDKDPQARKEWERDFKLKNDPRITALGHFIRKTSIDELPQLWNVLKGDMSLVGPRPIVEKEKEYYRDAITDYMSVRPGITGLWQVSGRNDTTYEERVRLDSWYVYHWSFWNDIVILLKTVHVVIARSGAY